MPTDIFKANCPGCGAEVVFRSATSAMAVCGYCNTRVLKQGAGVADAGKLSAVLEDYTPLQINTSGLLDGAPFTLVGRLQLAYADGHWNEWVAMFDDGSAGWLADASGQYVFTREVPLAGTPPLFEKLAAGNRWSFDGRNWYCADVRTAQARAGQGELPIAIGEGWTAKVADFRSGREFLTLDYSFGEAPLLYRGKAVTLPDLKCQLLRDDQQIVDAAGRYRGALSALDCPQCGSPIAHAPGLTTGAVCAACGSEVAIDGAKAEVLVAHDAQEAHETTLRLGDAAKIDGVDWVVLGVMAATNPDEAEAWTEYLLFAAGEGFLWLVESSEGWQRVRVADEWPDPVSDDAVGWRKRTLPRKWAYPAQVTWAAGAFNWRVHVGDTRQIIDYSDGSLTLTRESSAQEMSFSLAERVTATAVGQWFGRGDITEPAGAGVGDVIADMSGRDDAARLVGGGASLGRVFVLASTFLWLLNLPIIGFGDGSFILTAIAQAAILPQVARQFVGDGGGSKPVYIAYAFVVLFLATIINLASANDDGPSRSWGSGGSGYSSGGSHK